MGFTGSADEADEASFYTESKAERQGCHSLPSPVHDLLPKARSSGKKGHPFRRVCGWVGEEEGVQVNRARIPYYANLLHRSFPGFRFSYD